MNEIQIYVKNYDEFLNKLADITKNYTLPFRGDVNRSQEVAIIKGWVMENGIEDGYIFTFNASVSKHIVNSLIQNEYIRQSGKSIAFYTILGEKIKKDRIGLLERQRKEEEERKEKELEKERRDREYTQRENQFKTQMDKWELDYKHKIYSAKWSFLISGVSIAIAVISLFVSACKENKTIIVNSPAPTTQATQ